MARVLVWLSIALGVWAQEEESTKLVACLALSRHVILDQAESLSSLIEKSPFDQEQVITKMMTTMVTRCLKNISPAKALDIIQAAQTSSSLEAFTSLVPVPSTPYTKESQVKLTREEEKVYRDMMDIQEKAERHGAGGGERESEVPFVGTQAGIVTILVVFALVAGLIVYLLKAMQESEEQVKED